MKYKVESIKAIGGEGVVFNIINLSSGKSDMVLKMPKSQFNPVSVLSQKIDQKLRSAKFDPDEIIEMCDQLLEFDPKSEFAAFNKGTTLSIKGEFEKALECYDLAISISPDDLTNWINKANTLIHLNRHQEFVESLTVASNINPKQFREYINNFNEQAATLNSALLESKKNNLLNKECSRLLDEYF